MDRIRHVSILGSANKLALRMSQHTCPKHASNSRCSHRSFSARFWAFFRARRFCLESFLFRTTPSPGLLADLPCSAACACAPAACTWLAASDTAGKLAGRLPDSGAAANAPSLARTRARPRCSCMLPVAALHVQSTLDDVAWATRQFDAFDQRQSRTMTSHCMGHQCNYDCCV